MADIEDERVRNALATDLTIDIITTGARSGLPRETEIWFTRVDGEIYICGTPAEDGGVGPRFPRDWLANMKAHPEFIFRLKESVVAELPARAVIVTDAQERRRVYSAPEAGWYLEQTGSLDRLVADAPLVRVEFV
ncbi:MAG: nitroreductase/quinone reductase family protein [Acidimicrobiales bacterium]